MDVVELVRPCRRGKVALEDNLVAILPHNQLFLKSQFMYRMLTYEFLILLILNMELKLMVIVLIGQGLWNTLYSIYTIDALPGGQSTLHR